ncbi:TonB-dependent receptor [Aquimarina sp. 2201CG5-10]|uniref:TonB-dependent receptor n=1 Tax=Aquimarina callyspongiae TaxID=3098150 RepID=UPI002AB43817|nr:TonB-dependent receptor [Aquimarina sp. 2201CG5-10]MDY8134032.1 TonB-dependent receptor [Aquimarina sp. 2201CG5-10]
MKKKFSPTLPGNKYTWKKSALLMKLSLSFYLLGCAQLLAINAISQNKVSIDVKNTHLQTIIEQIETQTSYSFIYNNDEIDENLKLNIKAKNENVTKVLARLFNKTPIQYLIKNNHVILTSKKDRKDSLPRASQSKKYTISGTLTDTSSGETLLGANIIIKDHNKGAVTNEYGFYSITLPEKTYVVQFSYIGYEPKEIEVVLTENKKLNIELDQVSSTLDEVVLTAQNNSKSQVKNVFSGISSLKSGDIKKLPSLLGEADVTRAFLTQPGVTSVGEGTTGFNVRGGNIDQNLVLLDEAPIYNSSHIWGFFSIFNTDAIKDLKLYKGGIPARFGGRASSVLEIRQKEGSDKKFKGEGGLGLLFSRLTLEGPIKKEKLSFLVSGRRSYFDLFFPLLGDEIKNNRIHFYDVNTKIKWNINENNKLFASGYFGADVMQLKFEGETNPDGTVENDENIDFRWKNATATLRWNHIFSDKLFMNLSGIYSRYDYNLSSQNDTGGGPVNTSGSFTWKSEVENWIIKPDFTLFQNTDTKIRFGLNSTLYRFTPARVSSAEEGINAINFETEKGLEIAPYAEYERTWKSFHINAGLRYSWFGNIGPYTVSEYDPNQPLTVNTITNTRSYKSGEVIKSYTGLEPRLSLKYDLAENKAFKLSYNRMFQYIHLISNTTAALPFDIWKPSGAHIKPLEVNQFSGGYAYDTPDNMFNFSLEGYYKTFKNIVEYKNGADLFLNENLETQLLSADGYSYGAEFGVHKTRGKFTGNLNYTYSQTKRKTTSRFSTENINNGEYYPSNYDRPHVLNLNTNYKLGKKWNVGMFFTYQTGRPTTQPTGRVIVDDVSYLTYSDRNAYRIPDTHRMDISFTYTPNRSEKRWKSSWSFGVYNIYSRKNAFSVYSVFNNEQLRTFQFSVIGSAIPFITYNFKF